MWFNSIPVDLRFCAVAPEKILTQLVVPVPAERLYEVLLTGENQTVWAQGYVQTVWYNASPYARGSIRDIHLQWIRVRERLLALEPGRRFAFSSDALTVPLVRRMVEDIQFVTLDAHTTRIDWLVCYELAWGLRPLAGLLRPVFTKMFADFAHGLANYAARPLAHGPYSSHGTSSSITV